MGDATAVCSLAHKTRDLADESRRRVERIHTRCHAAAARPSGMRRVPAVNGDGSSWEDYGVPGFPCS
jgi:hypothetical protein